jgi:thiamine pyrophosphokinase
MRGVIFANGVIKHPQDVRAMIRSDDVLIAADGGAAYCMAIGILPTAVVGDFDSLSTDEQKTLQDAKVDLIRYPARKDQTDLELALWYAVERGADEILVFGALGARWDMTVANVLLLAAPELKNVAVRLIDGRQEISLLRGQGELKFQGKKGDTLSLIPLGGNASGVSLLGLEYPLEDGMLKFGSSRGISNVMIEDSATVRQKRGLLLCVFLPQ